MYYQMDIGNTFAVPPEISQAELLCHTLHSLRFLGLVVNRHDTITYTITRPWLP